MNVIQYNSHESSPTVSRKAAVSGGVDWIFRIGVVGIVILGFVQLLLLNSLATQGFVLQGIKQERLELLREIETWDIELARVTSLYALGSSEQVQEMESVEDKKFVKIRQGRLAMR